MSGKKIEHVFLSAKVNTGLAGFSGRDAQRVLKGGNSTASLFPLEFEKRRCAGGCKRPMKQLFRSEGCQEWVMGEKGGGGRTRIEGDAAAAIGGRGRGRKKEREICRPPSPHVDIHARQSGRGGEFDIFPLPLSPHRPRVVGSRREDRHTNAKTAEEEQERNVIIDP